MRPTKPMPDKHKVLTIPILLVFAGVLLPYLLPAPDTLETILHSYLKNKWLIWLAKSSTILLVFSLVYCFYLNPGKKYRQDEKEIYKLIKENTITKYTLHINELSKNFDRILNKYASRGFSIPPGSMAGDICDLYKNEIGVFSKILADSILEAIQKLDNSTFYQSIFELIEEMISNKCSEIKELYEKFLTNYYKSNKDDDHIETMNRSFSSQINKEAELRINELILTLKLKQ